MKYQFRIVLLFAIFYYGINNSIVAQPKVEFNCVSNFIEVDNFGNIYAVNQTELIKYSLTGKLLHRYSNQINGVITSVDVTNPLRIVLFCRESNTITFLNQQLAPIAEPIDIYDITGVEAENAGASTEGGFWMYSAENQSAMLFNKQLKKIQESQNLSNWVKADSIKYIKEQNQKLYLVLPQKVVVLDLFGSYLSTIHFNDAKNIRVGVNKISYQKNGVLFVYDMLLKAETEIDIRFAKGATYSFYYNNSVYVVGKSRIMVF